METITIFLSLKNGYGNGYGNGDGSGDGSGWGDSNAYGRGYGRGSGDGYGSGYGNGKGFGGGFGGVWGYGCGYGCGDGGGNGNGSGEGYDIKSYNGQKVYIVDGIETIIHSVKNNIAKGATLNNDLTLSECYIAKVGDYFAHGQTAHEAFADAQAKALQDEPIEERIKRFTAQYPDFDRKIPAQELFDWHNILTGSCEFGRLQFAESHGINLETDSFTVKEFIELTKDEYGGEIIKRLITYCNDKTD